MPAPAWAPAVHPAAHPVELVQQAFEFVVGDQVIGVGCRRRRTGACRQSAGARWRRRCCSLGFERERRNQVGRSGFQRLLLLDGVYHLLKPVQRALGRIEVAGLEGSAAGAGNAQGLLGRVAQFDQGGGAEEAGTALDRVEGAEDRVQQFAVGRVLLQRDQLSAQVVKQFARFQGEVGRDLR